MYDFSKELKDLDCEILELENQWRIGVDKVKSKSNEMNQSLESVKELFDFSFQNSTNSTNSMNESKELLNELQIKRMEWIQTYTNNIHSQLKSLEDSRMNSELQFEIDFLTLKFTPTQSKLLQCKSHSLYLSEMINYIKEIPPPDACLIQDDYESNETDRTRMIKLKIQECMNELKDILDELGPLYVSSPAYNTMYDHQSRIYTSLEDIISLV